MNWWFKNSFPLSVQIVWILNGKLASMSNKVRNYKPAFFPYQPPRRFGPKGLLMEFRLQIL